MSQVDLLEAVAVRLGLQGKEAALRSNLYLLGLDDDHQLQPTDTSILTIASSGVFMLESGYPAAAVQRAMIHLSRQPPEIIRVGMLHLLDGKYLFLPLPPRPGEEHLPNGQALDVDTLKVVSDEQAEQALQTHIMISGLSLANVWSAIEPLIQA